MDPVVNTNAPRYIPVAKPSLTVAEADAARDCILAGWVSGGPCVSEFEVQLAAAHGKRYGVSTNSGTTALHLALAALDVGPGDQVLLPTLTMVAVANAVLYRGATPVFVDSEFETGNPDPAWAARCDTLNARTKAVVVPHLYGVPAEGFLAAVQSHTPNVPVVEDCAEAHYASFRDGRPIGSRGWLACWSFYGNKIITTGEGGLVATNDPRAAERLRSLRAHAFTPGNHFQHQELAYGYRMSEPAAAVGLAQHARREALLRRRGEIARRYIGRLQGHGGMAAPARTLGSAWWVFPVVFDSHGRRERVRKALADAGVETRTYFVPLHQQPHLCRYATALYPVADDLSRRGMYLPLWPGMSDDDVDYVCGLVIGH
jgi:perosamine synthetase